MPLTPDPLDSLLDRWGQPPLQRSVTTEVRRRIAAREATARAGGWRAIVEVFRQPAFSAAFVAACVLLGLFLAEVRVSQRHALRDQELAQSYRRLIDPLIAESTTLAAISVARDTPAAPSQP